MISVAQKAAGAPERAAEEGEGCERAERSRGQPIGEDEDAGHDARERAEIEPTEAIEAEAAEWSTDDLTDGEDRLQCRAVLLRQTEPDSRVGDE